jgi:hypothetical protein
MKKLARVLALVVGTSFVTSCATIREDPVMCGVIGSVVMGVAGAGFAVAVAHGNGAFPGILGGTLGFAAGGYGGYQICKYPDFSGEKPRKAAPTGSAAEPEPEPEPDEPEMVDEEPVE